MRMRRMRVPVAEYTLGMIFLSLKRVWENARHLRETKEFRGVGPVIGAYGSTVGLMSLGAIGRKVVELLRPFDMKVIAYDPMVKEMEGVEMVGLGRAFSAKADVVSVHTPWLAETTGLVTGKIAGVDEATCGLFEQNASRGRGAGRGND